MDVDGSAATAMLGLPGFVLLAPRQTVTFDGVSQWAIKGGMTV